MVRIAGRPLTPADAARYALTAVAAILVAYLAVLAAWPWLLDTLPAPVRWFGAPNSAVTIAVVVVVFCCAAIAFVQAHPGRRSATPVAVVAALAVVTTVLGMASYWRCQDESNPDFFTPLVWTAKLVKNGDPAQSLADGTACPSPMPAALHVAQVSALAAVFMSVVAVAMTLFRSRIDRLRVALARSVTAVVGLDADVDSLISAVARTLPPRSTLVVVTDDPDTPSVARARTAGARVLIADLDRHESLVELPMWQKIDRLYLVAADPSTNLLRLRTITAHGGDERQRLPLIVRIDDPWQAAAWRAQHFGGIHNRWAADTVGVYEVTARRLLDRILAGPPMDRLLVCGSSPLTTALCNDMLVRRLEFEYSGRGWLPALSVVTGDAIAYAEDYIFTSDQMGHPDRATDIDPITEAPTVATLLALVEDGEPATTVIVLTERTLDVGAATRISARLPTTTIHTHDPRADAAQERLAVIGRLYTYRLSLDMPGGQAHDAWERAAALIHDRYVADSGGTGPAAVPWVELDEFYRESNRRQVRNALWMVEKIGGHTWNTWGRPGTGAGTARLRGMTPSEQLREMGFDADTVRAMARAEHEDWCRYYRAHGWRHGDRRDDAAKVHDRLVDWSVIESDPERLDAALRSLSATLTKLRELGYRSAPVTTAADWKRFRRNGIVRAEQRATAWTWTAHDGSTMLAEAGDWAVRGASGTEWSVRDDIFRATHENVGGDRWRRRGTVLARPAVAGERVETLEGASHAPEGSWIVQGDHGDVWAVPAEEFAQRYRPADQDTSNPAG